MPKCVPIREMKDTGRFTELVKTSSEPITVTRNGCDAMVVMSTEYWESLQLQLAKADLLARIDVSEREIAHGEYVDASLALERLRERHGL